MTALPGSARQLVEDLGEALDVVVPEPLHGGAGELGAGEQRVVGVLVEDDEVVAVEQAADGADVGDVAGGEHQRGFPLVELGQLGLEGAVEVEGAVEEAGAGDPGAVPTGGRLGGFDHLRVVREAQVVVGAEVDVVVALDGEPGLRGALDRLVVRPVARFLGQPVVGQPGVRLEAVAKEAHPRLTPTSPRPPASGPAYRSGRESTGNARAPWDCPFREGWGRVQASEGSGRPIPRGSSRICLQRLRA